MLGEGVKGIGEYTRLHHSPLQDPNLPTQRLHLTRLATQFKLWQKCWGRALRGLENIHIYTAVYKTRTFLRGACTLLDSCLTSQFSRKTGAGK